MKCVASHRIGSVLGLAFLLGGLPVVAGAAVRPGIELGANLSTLSYDHPDVFPIQYWDRGWRPSFTGGVSLEFPIREQFSLVTGLRYIEQGNRVRFDLPSSFADKGRVRFVQRYLSMPVLATLHPARSRGLFVAVGPEVALLLSARSTLEYDSGQFPSDSENIKDDLEKINVLADAAAGFEFPLQGHTGLVSLRYAYGLLGVAKKEHWASGWKTQDVELLVGMRR